MKKSNKLVVYSVASVIIVVALIIVIVTSSKSSIAKPEGLTAQNAADSIILTWTRVRGASNYEIYKKVSGQWELQETTKEKTYTDSCVNDGKTYSYEVRAKSTISESEFSEIKYLHLREPIISNAENTPNGIKISWNKAEKASSYTVFRKEAPNSDENAQWLKIKDLSAEKTSYTDADTQNGKTYSYCIMQTSGKYTSGYGNSVQEIICSEAVKNLTASNSPQGVTLTWKKYTDAVGYTLFRKSDGDEEWEEIATIGDETTYNDKDAVYGKENSYQVCAVLQNGEKSALSSSVTLYGIDPNKKMVALTFDDGPYRPVTTKILDTVEKYNARVTFFVVGSRVDNYSDCVKRAADLGCEIGCHTYNHITLTTLSTSEMKKEITDTVNVVKKYIGTELKIVRCPGGIVNDEVKTTVKYPLINWSVDTLDWKTRNTQATVNNMKNHITDGSIVLMHDLYDSTAAAIEQIIPYLIEKGYQIVTVSEMMEAKGVEPMSGQLYYSIT